MGNDVNEIVTETLARSRVVRLDTTCRKAGQLGACPDSSQRMVG